MIQELVRRTTLVVVLFPVGVSFSFLLCLDIRVSSSWFQWPNTFFHFFIFLRTQRLLVLDLLWIALSVIQFMPLQVSDLREDGHAVATGEPFLFPGLSKFHFAKQGLVTGNCQPGRSVPDVGGMAQFVSSQVTGLVVGGRAEPTSEGLLPGVGSDVPLHVTVGGEGITALTAHKGSVACVDQQVALQVVGLGEARVADVAGVRLLPGVDQVVFLQVTGCHERHLADVTPVRTIA